MQFDVVDGVDSEKTESAIKAEQIRLLFHQGMPIQVLGLFSAAIPLFMFRQVADFTQLIWWFSAMMVVTLARLWLDIRFSRVPKDKVDIGCWGNLYILGTFVSGLLWGCLTLFYDPSWPIAHQIVLFVIYTGIIAGAFNTNSPVKWAFPAFFLPPVLFLMYVMLSYTDRFGELALLFIIYITLMAITSQRYYQRLKESLRVMVLNEALAQALEESNWRLTQLSEVDELTQLYNRRTMDRFLEEEWERYIRNEKPFSLLFIDIDYFKQFNDTYGHIKGDEVLIQVASIFRHCAQRVTDMAARFGGEEFAIIFPGTAHADAMRIAEEVREAVEALAIEHDGSQCCECVTVSIGVATMTPEPGSSFKLLTAEADKMLYQAKAGGRNRVVGSETQTDETELRSLA